MHKIQSNRVHPLTFRRYLSVALDFMIEVPHEQSLYTVGMARNCKQPFRSVATTVRTPGLSLSK
jgi:hypothetical protein